MATHDNHNIQLTLNKPVLTIIIFLMILLVIVLPYFKQILLLITVPFFLSLLLETIINRFESNGIQRITAIILSVVFLVLFGLFWIFFVTPRLTFEIESIKNLVDSSVLITAANKLSPDSSTVIQIAVIIQSVTQLLINKSIIFTDDKISNFLILFIISMITFFMLKNGYFFKRAFIQKLPNRYFEMTLDLSSRLHQQLSSWIKNQISIVVMVSALTMSALFFLQVSHYLLAGLMAGLAFLIPYYGPIIGALLTSMIIFMETSSPDLLLGVIIAIATIKLLCNFILPSNITTQSNHLKPFVILLLILLGSYMWGIMGMLLIVPICSLILLIFEEVLWSMKHYRLF